MNIHRIEVELVLESEPEWIRKADELALRLCPERPIRWVEGGGVKWLSEREKSPIALLLSFISLFEILLPSTAGVQESFPFRIFFIRILPASYGERQSICSWNRVKYCCGVSFNWVKRL